MIISWSPAVISLDRVESMRVAAATRDEDVLGRQQCKFRMGIADVEDHLIKDPFEYPGH